MTATTQLDRDIAWAHRIKDLSPEDLNLIIDAFKQERAEVPADAPDGRLVNVTFRTNRRHTIDDADDPEALLTWQKLSKGERLALREQMLSCAAYLAENFDNDSEVAR